MVVVGEEKKRIVEQWNCCWMTGDAREGRPSAIAVRVEAKKEEEEMPE